MGLRKPWLDFHIKVAVAIYTAVQFGSFAFNDATVPTHPELQDTLAWTRELGMGTGIFSLMFLTACSMVAIFLLVMIVQEMIEWRMFLHPKNDGWQKLWLGASIFAQTMATVGFIPLCRTLVRSGDCTIDESTGLYWLDALNGTKLNPVPEADKL